MKKILFIAPFPPPITGQSYASQFLFEKLNNQYEIVKINYSRENPIEKSKFDLSFIKKIISLGKIIKKESIKSDVIYLTLSQSLLGNIKDLYFLFKIRRDGRQKAVVHLHGGYFHFYFEKQNFIIKKINRILLKNIKAGIVLGESLKKCLAPVIEDSKIKIVKNFYLNEFKISTVDLNKKWDNPEIINLLYLSNMMKEKGYEYLLESFINLPENLRTHFTLTFAGNFENEQNKNDFLVNIYKFKNIKYEGVITGKMKHKILMQSHVFILPTFYPIEGQPISILEAYAAGLAVITTEQGGIPDIFTNKINGRYVQKRSSESITKEIVEIYKNKFYKDYAFNNYKFADQFDENYFIKSIMNIFES